MIDLYLLKNLPKTIGLLLPPNCTFSETNGKKQKENYQKFWKDKCV